MCFSVRHSVCSLFHLLLFSVCWNTLKCPGQSALGAVLRLSVECVSVYSTCVLTVSPVALQRVLEHVEMPRAVSTRCCSALYLLSVFQCTALVCSLFHLLLFSVCWNTLKCPGQSALGAVLRLSVECVSVYSTCVLTVSPVARQSCAGTR